MEIFITKWNTLSNRHVNTSYS